MIETVRQTLNHLAPVWARYGEVMVSHGEGVWLYDLEGNRYLDFTSGIGVVNTGHTHPRVVAAIQEQAAKLIHGQANLVYHQPMLRLIEALLEVVPSRLDTFFFSNSGAEAVEGAIKLARQATGRPVIVAFQGGFHGRTMGTLSLTSSKALYRAGYQPLMAGVVIAPYPDPYRYGMDAKECREFCIRELRYILATQCSPKEVAAVIVEPILGEGGYIVPPSGFLRDLRTLCDEHQILLIVDEIQTGFGRTGRFFAMEHEEVIPDILVMAKGLASGMPLSAIAAPRELMEKWPTGSHGGTYGGNAIACAAAVATMHVLRKEGLVKNSAARGRELLEGLEEIASRYLAIGEVRGKGLMVAAEFSRDKREPWVNFGKEVVKAALKRRLMLMTCGPYDHIVRFVPPLVVKSEEINKSLSIFEESLQEALTTTGA